MSGQVAAGENVSQHQTVAASDEGEGPEPGPAPLVVLFLAANPLDTDRLQLDEEVRTIDQRLREGDGRDRLELRQHWATRTTDLSHALFRHRPAIVHFSGHGDPNGRLMLQDEQGRSFGPSPRAVAGLFSTAGGSVRCVVLNACHSVALAGALVAHVDCVVGTTRAMTDVAAHHFAAGFYRAIGFGESIRTAYDVGRNEIELVGAGAADVVALLTRPGVDAADIRLLTP